MQQRKFPRPYLRNDTGYGFSFLNDESLDMSQQEEDPSHYTRTLVVKPALSQMYDQLLPKLKSLETACKTTALIRRRPITCVYLDLGISQTDNGLCSVPCSWVQAEQDHYTGLCSNQDNKRPQNKREALAYSGYCQGLGKPYS